VLLVLGADAVRRHGAERRVDAVQPILAPRVAGAGDGPDVAAGKVTFGLKAGGPVTNAYAAVKFRRAATLCTGRRDDFVEAAPASGDRRERSRLREHGVRAVPGLLRAGAGAGSDEEGGAELRAHCSYALGTVQKNCR